MTTPELARLAEVTGGATVRTLREILDDPDAIKPPTPVVPRFAWENRVTLLAMREKGGKSTIASYAAANVSNGGFVLGQRCRAGAVLWFNLEEFTGDLANRLVQFGADPERVFVVDRMENPIADYAEAVMELRPALVVIDTLPAFADLLAESPEPGSSAQWTPVMAALARPIRETGAALLLLHHARKSDGTYRDSTAIGAGVDMILEVVEAKDGTVRKVKPKGRWHMEPFSYTMTSTGDFQLMDGELSIEAKVLTYVINNPACSQRDVEAHVEGRSKDIRDAIKALLRSESIVDEGTAATGMQLRAPVVYGGASEGASGGLAA